MKILTVELNATHHIVGGTPTIACPPLVIGEDANQGEDITKCSYGYIPTYPKH